MLSLFKKINIQRFLYQDDKDKTFFWKIDRRNVL